MTRHDFRSALDPPAWAGARARRWALGAGFAGTVAWALGAWFDPPQAYFSYLTAYIFAVGLAVGMLLLIIIEHLVGASWFVVMRRLAEHVAAAVLAMAMLFLPIVAGARWLFPWTDVNTLAPHARELVEQKTAYLNLPFFLARAAVYLACWIAIALLLRRWSLRQDTDEGERWQKAQRRLSAGGVIVMAFTLTFAAFDWVMSLAPTWVSTIFGVQIFSGAMVGALGLLGILVARAASEPPLDGVIRPDHFAAIGKMMLTFVIFWAYATFVQLLIIWIADVPEEVTWYLPRIHESWLWTGAAVAFGQFVIPFFTLLSFRLKRRARVIATLGWIMLAAHYAEVYWIVVPQFAPQSAVPHWQDLAAAAMVLGVASAWVSWSARAHSPLAIGDPSLDSALAYSDL